MVLYKVLYGTLPGAIWYFTRYYMCSLYWSCDLSALLWLERVSETHVNLLGCDNDNSIHTDLQLSYSMSCGFVE